MSRFEFDERYYQRFYVDPATRVTSAAEVAVQARFIGAYLEYMQVPVRRILDVGCGFGLLREPLLAQFPRATYTGIEFSEYLCEQHGWKQGSVVDYRSRTPFDLVVCQDVLQYLPDRAAAAAIDNLAVLSRGALYFGALTRGDWEDNCDQVRTDPNGYLRSDRWYRRRLNEHFVNVGGGVHLARSANFVLFELERCE